jgi:GDP-L-fucose synthase
MIKKQSKIYIAGHNGMVGSAIIRELNRRGYKNLIFKDMDDLDLRNQAEVYSFLEDENPAIIINAAAKVGGILANDTYPYEFIMDNMLIQNNLISSAHKLNIKKFIFLGSSCIYPKFSKQPIKEEYLLTDTLEPTNEWYAIAKISGVKAIEALRKQYDRDYISLMPTNLFGINDNFNLETSHVLPALIRKFHDAKINNKSHVLLWGSGTPKREFLFVDDLASAVVFSIENKLNESLYNVGYGTDISIKDVATLIKNIVGYKGDIEWDKSKPDGTPRKLMDSSKLNNLGWKAKYNLEEGINHTYNWFTQKINL